MRHKAITALARHNEEDGAIKVGGKGFYDHPGV
jgi:hypothetical protein